MTTDMPSSDEMIRRAKEKLQLAKEDFLPMVEEDLVEAGMSIGGVDLSTGDEMFDEAPPVMPSPQTRKIGEVAQSVRARRVESSSQEPLVVTSRSQDFSPHPLPPSPFSPISRETPGRWMLVVGNVILVFIALTWVMLLIGLITNPEDLGEAIGGGAVTTIVPFIFGLVLRRAGKRAGIAV
ncbi:MAG: hypothetical protein ABFR53_08490 [Actinomycetota bacterium]